MTPQRLCAMSMGLYLISMKMRVSVYVMVVMAAFIVLWSKEIIF